MKYDEWYERDPFQDQYLTEELAFYGAPNYERDGLRLLCCSAPPVLRIDDYLNVNMRVNMPPVPSLFLDGELWMSITPMELQAQHLPIQFAQGIVGTAGLGLGHFTLRTAAMPHVEEVHVFERDQRVVDCFLAVHGNREGVEEKVRFHMGDACEELLKTDVPLDTLYVDIYSTLCCDQAVEDIRRLIEVVEDPSDYTWWGAELVMLNCMVHGLIDFLNPSVARYLRMWMASDLGKLRHKALDLEYCEAVIDAAHYSPIT